MADIRCQYCSTPFHESLYERVFEDWEKHLRIYHINEWKAMTPREIAAMEWKMKMRLRNQTPQIL